MATGYVGGNDAYIPTLDLSGNLMIGFSRNVKKYPVNRYVSLTPVKQSRGAYLYFNPLDNARLQNHPNSTKWASGTRRPKSGVSRIGFEEKTFTTVRHQLSTEIDQRAIDLANWPVLKRATEEVAKDMMVARAIRCITQLTTTANYPAGNVKTAAALGVGFLDGGNSADPRILKALTEADLIIQNATGGRVTPGELSVLMNHNTAVRLSRSRELREYVMQQEDAWKQIVLGKDSYNSAYYLPDVLYRHNVVVESLQYNAGNRGGATDDVFTPIFPDNAMLVFLREGDLESEEGEDSYSTCHQFVREDMNVEVWPDSKHRLVEITVTDETDEKIVAPVTGVYISNIFS